MIKAALFLVALVPGVLGALARLGAPDAVLHDRIWTERRPGATEVIDHAAWDDFLGRYVTADAAGVNRVAYGAVSPADRAAIDDYIGALETVQITSFNPDEQLAYWINLYNAVTVRTVLDAYPVDSIREIGTGLFAAGPWERDQVSVMGRELSLNDIEHGIIRPVYNEPRIHFAVNCAAVGCPNLADTAFDGAKIDAQFAAAEHAYIHDPRGVRIEGDDLVLSKIWLWFQEDFGADEAEVIEGIRAVADGPLAEALAGRRSVDAYVYDWALNDAR